ncbi:hypothetical protein V1477_004161, partial [Vespula maculifrons]
MANVREKSSRRSQDPGLVRSSSLRGDLSSTLDCRKAALRESHHRELRNRHITAHNGGSPWLALAASNRTKARTHLSIVVYSSAKPSIRRLPTRFLQRPKYSRNTR